MFSRKRESEEPLLTPVNRNDVNETPSYGHRNTNNVNHHPNSTGGIENTVYVPIRTPSNINHTPLTTNSIINRNTRSHHSREQSSRSTASHTSAPLFHFSPVFLAWKDLTYKVKTKMVVSSSSSSSFFSASEVDHSTTSATVHKVLLRNISGFVQSGSMLAILGPTGSGKTTLLDLLADRKSQGSLQGEIILNGNTLHRVYEGESTRLDRLSCGGGNDESGLLERTSGYVQQEDLLLSYLTIEETLRYAVTLRTFDTVHPAEVQERVERVLRQLNLTHLRHRRIGNTLVRGLSGGERKRCALGVELAALPSLLFLDEPTTGLDTFSALHVLSILRSLASAGMAIVCTIHQPRADIFSLFDDLLLLNSHGEEAFFGPVAEAVPFLTNLGISLPTAVSPSSSPSFDIAARFNPADFLLDAVSSVEQGSTVGVNGLFKVPAPTQGRDIAAAFEATRLGSVLEEIEHNRNRNFFVTNPGDVLPVTLSEAGGIEYGVQGEAAEFRPIVTASNSRCCCCCCGCFRCHRTFYFRSFGTQVRTVCARAFKNKMRDPITTSLAVAAALLFAVLIGTMYRQLGHEQGSIRDRMGVLFFIMMNTTFSSLGSLEMFLTDRALYSREHQNRMYSAGAFFIAKVIHDVPFGILINTIFNVIVYVLVGLQPSFFHFFVFNLTCGLVMLNSYALCLLVSIVSSGYAVANIVSSLILVLFLLPTGGVLVHLDSIPFIWRWIKHVSFVRYGFAVLVSNEFDGLEFTCAADVPPSSNHTNDSSWSGSSSAAGNSNSGQNPNSEAPFIPCIYSGSLYAASEGFYSNDQWKFIAMVAGSFWIYLFLGYLALCILRSREAK